MSNPIRYILENEYIFSLVAANLFGVADTDASGAISLAELGVTVNEMYTSFGMTNLTAEEVQALLTQLDVDEDGSLSLDEYKVLLHQILELIALTLD